MLSGNILNFNGSEWLPISEVSKILNLSIKSIKRNCKNNKYEYFIINNSHKKEYYIKESTIKEIKYSADKPVTSYYADAPIWAKKQVEKYIPILNKCLYAKGKKLKEILEEWNDDPNNIPISYPSFIKMRKRYIANGIEGLLAKYGHSKSKTIISNAYVDYFKNLYLVEGSPSLQSCWDITLGYAMKTDENITKDNFPSPITFKRRIEKLIPKQSIYLARNGQSAWNRKYGGYIERDYSNIICGEVWVSDHAQIDVACFDENGKVVFPWVTVWRDYKSSKWLGWYLQTGNPNSDHIFQTFYYSAVEYGLPKSIIIDNGKDYRSKDFAGGRKHFKIDTNKTKTNSMLKELNVDVHFALPYNAQTKPVERDFLKIKELLSKHCVGYRGGNVVERPEKLADEIKNKKIMMFEDFKKIFDDFIVNVLNKRPSQGKNLKGLAPDELFYKEFNEKITPSKDALKLFCMRTSRNFTIGRNGIQDKSLGITYWADWMISSTSRKVYLRRDIQNFKEAWVFDCSNDEFIGKCEAVRAVAALYADKISKEEFKEAMAIKKRNLKIAKEYIKQTQEISLDEQCQNYKIAYASVEKSNKKQPKISKIANTNMDKVIQKNKDMEAFKNQDLSMFAIEPKKEVKPFYLFETEKQLEEEYKLLVQKGVINGS